jgi:hypothetical protein
MVSSRKKSKQTKADAPEEVEQAETSKKLFPTEVMSPREKRRRQREDLKVKNSGTGLAISTKPASTTNKKIIFDDETEPAIEEEDEVHEEPVEEQNKEEQDDDDDDDDAVEEVKGGEARDEIASRMKAERETAVRPKKKKKRKERKQVEVEKDEDEELDDDFLAQVDSVLSEEQKKRKLQDADKPKGNHITFVFHQEDKEADMTPKPVDHNIQVVVLKDQSATNAVVVVPTTKLSEEAMLYSRGRLDDGKDGGSPPQRSKKRQRKEDPTWQRSKKMNNLALARVNRRGGRGNAKALFAVKR